MNAVVTRLLAANQLQAVGDGLVGVSPEFIVVSCLGRLGKAAHHVYQPPLTARLGP